MPPTSRVVKEDRSLPPRFATEWPFTPHYTPLADGVRMHHAEVGEGAPVVFVHGNPTWGFLWRRFLRPVADLGYRALAPDLVGCGRSDKPVDAAYHSVDRHVRNLEAWMDALALEDVTLVVHDWGGPIGLGWAGRHPERVKRLVILNTVAFAPRRARSLSTFHGVFGSPAGDVLGRHLNLLVETAVRFGVKTPMDATARAAYRWPFRGRARRAAPLALARMVPDGPGHASADAIRRVETGLEGLAKKPALVLWGDADPVFPRRFADKWTTALPLAELTRFPEGAHFLQEDVPDALVARLVAWLKAA